MNGYPVIKWSIKRLVQFVHVMTLGLMLAIPAQAEEDARLDNRLDSRLDNIEQQLLEAMIKTTILAFEQPQMQSMLGQFSELVKDERSYQFIIQKIDKFILTNELEQYEEQAEALKDALANMRELYIRSEEKTLEKYNNMKRQQQEREKQRELKANGVLEV